MNKKYYLQNDVQAEKKFIYPERQDFITVGYELSEMKAD